MTRPSRMPRPSSEPVDVFLGEESLSEEGMSTRERMNRERRWVGWEIEQRGNAPTKVPVNPRTGERAKSNDPSTWGTLAEAEEVAKRHGLAGVGFMLGDGWAGIDIDGPPAWKKSPPWDETEALGRRKETYERVFGGRTVGEWIALIGGYWEFSPSLGIKGIAPGFFSEEPDAHKNAAGLELYSDTRFFAVTGDRILDRDQVDLDAFRALAACRPQRRAAQPSTAAINSGNSTAYGSRALESEVAELLRAQEGNRNNQLNTSAFKLGQLVAGGEVDEGEALEALERAALGTGLEPDEIRRTLERAVADGKAGPRKAPEKPAQRPVARSSRKEPEPERQQEQPHEQPPFVLEVVTAHELCARPDPDHSEDDLLGELIRRGYRIPVGAHTGEGKTTLTLAMLAAVVLGRDFLSFQGRGDIRALILDAEQGERTLKRRLREADLEDCDAVDVIRVPDGLALNADPRHVAELDRILRAGDYAIVDADPLYKLHVGNSNDEREAVDLMRQLDAWRDELGFALLQPTHCRKPLPGTKFSIHDLFGSSAYVRGAEVVLGLQRVRDGYSKLHFLKDRDGDLAIGTSWGLLFSREEGFRRDPDDLTPRTTAPDKVRELLETDELTITQLEKATNYANKTIRDALKKISAEKLSRSGPNGQPLWTLPTDEEAPQSGESVEPQERLL